MVHGREDDISTVFRHQGGDTNLRLFCHAGIWPTEGGVVHAISLIVARSPHCRFVAISTLSNALS